MATRAAGYSAYDPAGIYEATAAGMAAYNLTDAEPETGETFSALVEIQARTPRAGFAYLTITQAAGVLTSVAGPFFATSLPADSADVYHVPLVQSDGSGGLEQYHTGLLIWPEAGGGTPGADGTGLAWVALTSAAYDALDPPDPDTIYDITDADWTS